MKLFLLISATAFLISTSVFAKGGVKIFVDLSPAGSFEAVASKVKGKAKIVGDKIVAKKLTVSVKKLKTGLDLRDKHLWKKLNYKKYPKIIMLEAVGKNGKGQALFEIRGIKKKLPFTYKKVDAKYMLATFSISLKDFKFKGISYLSVGVKDQIKIEAYIRYK